MSAKWIRDEFPQLSGFVPLAKGGQKHVLSCQCPVHGEVVLKLMPYMGNDEEVRREIAAVSSIRAKKVPVIHDYGVKHAPLQSFFWIIEEKIPGITLREALAKATLSHLQVLKLSLDCLESLAKAESKAIVHRDVKPDNILNDSRADDYWLLDFGIARHLNLVSLTPSASPFGKITPGYAPPEQINNRKKSIDSRADLFAAGVTIFEATTGINPFRHHSRDDLEILHKTETLQLPPLVLKIQKADEFRDLLVSMTQKRRELRPKSVREALKWMRDICKSNQ